MTISDASWIIDTITDASGRVSQERADRLQSLLFSNRAVDVSNYKTGEIDMPALVAAIQMDSVLSA